MDDEWKELDFELIYVHAPEQYESIRRLERHAMQDTARMQEPSCRKEYDTQLLFQSQPSNLFERLMPQTYYISKGANPSILYSQFPPCSSLASQS